MTTPTIQPPVWRKIFSTYQKPRLSRSLIEIALTAGPLALFWTLGWLALSHDLVWVAALTAIPAAFFLVRLFLIQHDCGHHAFFKNMKLNDWVGRGLGIFTLTPYDCWRRTHAIHHATSGDLDRRGLGAIDTLTVEEFRALSPLRRFGYRLYRHPVVLFVVGPIYLFFLEQRWPAGIMKEGWRPWVSAMGTNIVVAGLVAAVLAFGGFKHLLLVHMLSLFLAGAIGCWLFFIQHQFEDAQWFRHKEWKHDDAALQGSSHYDLPRPLNWLTGHIGVHHVHHVASKIPFYRLPEVLKAHPELKLFNRLTLLQSLKCARYALWDEVNQRLISFRELKLIPERQMAMAA